MSRVSSPVKAHRNLARTLTGYRLTSRTMVINPDLCQKALDKLDLSSFKNPTIIDMNPSTGIWSAALHARLQPRQHILLEPDTRYHPHLKKFAGKHPNTQVVELNGHDWQTYSKIFNGPHTTPLFPEGFPKPQVRKLEGTGPIHPELLFTGYVTKKSEAHRLVTQFLHSCATKDWVQALGRVRFLLWLHDSDKERLLPRVVQARTSPSVITDAVTRVTEVVGAEIGRTGKGFSGAQIARKRKDWMDKWERQMGFVGARAQNLQRKSKDWEGKVVRATEESMEVRTEKRDRFVAQERKYLRSRLAKFYGFPYMRDATLPYASMSIGELRKMWGKLLKTPPEVVYELCEARLRGGDPPETADRRPENDAMGDDYEPQPTFTVTTTKNPPTTPDGEAQVYVPTPDERAAYADFERNYLTDRRVTNSPIDEEYALMLSPPLLQHWRQPYAPITIPTSALSKSFYPARALTLLDFSPIVLHPWLSASNTTERWGVFSWCVRNLFLNRAKTVRQALNIMCPGGEFILEGRLDDEGPDGERIRRVMAEKRVRVLTMDEIFAIVRLWMMWEFKPEGWGWEDDLATIRD